MQPGRLLSVVFVVALAAGFGVGRVAVGDGADPVAPDERSAPVAEAPPATTTPPEPLRVLLAGDSVMAGLVPAVEAALEPTGRAEVEFVLTPSILREPSVRFTWSQQLEELDPDVVVMFVGTWEGRELPAAGGGVLTPEDAAWATTYRDQVVDPWLELVTGHGAEVLWIGAPPVAHPVQTPFFDLLNGIFAELPDGWDQVTYLDPGPALGAGGAAFSPTTTGTDGRTVRLRQVDGLHLCPGGAERLAESVVESLPDRVADAVGTVWRDGPWRQDQGLYPVAACPSP